MLFNRNFFSIAILSGVLLLTTSCMDFSSEGGAAQDFSPITEKQDLFEKKLNQIVKKIDALQVSVNKINISNTAQNNKKEIKKIIKIRIRGNLLILIMFIAFLKVIHILWVIQMLRLLLQNFLIFNDHTVPDLSV